MCVRSWGAVVLAGLARWASRTGGMGYGWMRSRWEEVPRWGDQWGWAWCWAGNLVLSLTWGSGLLVHEVVCNATVTWLLAPLSRIIIMSFLNPWIWARWKVGHYATPEDFIRDAELIVKGIIIRRRLIVEMRWSWRSFWIKSWEIFRSGWWVYLLPLPQLL